MSTESSNEFNNLPTWIDAQLRAHQMSIEELANRSDLSRAAVYFYMTDKNRPSSQAMARICRTFGVPLSEGLKQYTPRKAGRPVGYKPAPREKY